MFNKGCWNVMLKINECFDRWDDDVIVNTNMTCYSSWSSKTTPNTFNSLSIKFPVNLMASNRDRCWGVCFDCGWNWDVGVMGQKSNKSLMAFSRYFCIHSRNHHNRHIGFLKKFDGIFEQQKALHLPTRNQQYEQIPNYTLWKIET